MRRSRLEGGLQKGQRPLEGSFEACAALRHLRMRARSGPPADREPRGIEISKPGRLRGSAGPRGAGRTGRRTRRPSAGRP
ncbi:hypothetical protein MRF4_11105 [Methylobacterium radiotolerans]